MPGRRTAVRVASGAADQGDHARQGGKITAGGWAVPLPCHW
ncbi:hypothetical protein [Streptomyces sp. RKAG293]|nr:hypothetical protein [Streptomyces sp. RKAG293]